MKDMKFNEEMLTSQTSFEDFLKSDLAPGAAVETVGAPEVTEEPAGLTNGFDFVPLKEIEEKEEAPAVAPAPPFEVFKEIPVKKAKKAKKAPAEKVSKEAVKETVEETIKEKEGSKKMNVYQKLMEVQSQLKAPKDQKNKFGGYNYRSCEDILEHAKPLLAKYGAIILLSDTVVLEGDRYYLEATAKFVNANDGETVEVKARAREDISKKGMDLSQLTGACSSYARKYALNGLLLIDDTKDMDFLNTGEKTTKAPAKQYNNSYNNTASFNNAPTQQPTPPQTAGAKMGMIKLLVLQRNLDRNIVNQKIERCLAKLGKQSVEQLTDPEFITLQNYLIK